MILMALADNKMNEIVIGQLTIHSVWTLRYLKIFFGTIFDFDQISEKLSKVTCVGAKLCNRNTETD